MPPKATRKRSATSKKSLGPKKRRNKKVAKTVVPVEWSDDSGDDTEPMYTPVKKKPRTVATASTVKMRRKKKRRVILSSSDEEDVEPRRVVRFGPNDYIDDEADDSDSTVLLEPQDFDDPDATDDEMDIHSLTTEADFASEPDDEEEPEEPEAVPMEKKEGRDRRRLRRLCFTWNNYDKEAITLLKSYCPSVSGEKSLCSYMIFGREVGKMGTPHLQGYCEFRKQQYFTKLLKLFKGAHLAKAMAGAEANRKYCSKDGKQWEDGEPRVDPKDSKRHDLEELKRSAMEGKTLYELMTSHKAAWRYNKSLQLFRTLHASQAQLEFQKLKVVVLVGAAGEFCLAPHT